MKPVVSIITAMHNQGEFAANCLESAIAQTYKNWELIIIDDYSTDDTAQIAKHYTQKDKRIKYFRNTKNWGVKNLHKTYNKAINLSAGEYIAFLEGDDWWPKDKLAKQITCFSDKDVVFSYGDAVMTRSNGFPIDVISYSGGKELNNDPVASILERFSDFSFFFLVSTVMIRKNVLREVRGFKKDRFFPFVDVPTWYELALKGKFFYYRGVLGYYRRHKTSSWVDVARDSDAMLRSEMKKMFWSFISRNKEKLKDLGFILDRKKFLAEQSKALIKKKRNKKFSIFLHTLLFDDSKLLNRAGHEVIEDNSIDIMRKTIVLAFVQIGPLKNVVLFLRFKLKEFLYRAKSTSA